MKHHEAHKMPVHHEHHAHGKDGANISDHHHPHHKGPHHEKYVHASNREQVSMSKHGSHAMGDKSHLKSLMGEPKGADVAGHKGKMKMGY
jgi:hypothetical protein